MDESDTNYFSSTLGLGSLVKAALEGDARGGITNLLKEIATLTKSFGCVLWRATLDAKPPDTGELTMLAAYFPVEKSHFGLKNAEFRDTVVGEAAYNDCGWAVDNDLVSHENPNCRKPFFVKNDLNRVVACRFHYLPRPEQEPRLGAVLIFRKATDAEYSESIDVRLLQQISRILPYLYSGARQKASYNLLKEVGEILRDTRKNSKPGHLTPKSVQGRALRQVAKALEATFHSVETSIFLEDDHAVDNFRCDYTSKGPHTVLVEEDSYQPSTDRGFSALCLLAKERIRVHDLLNPRVEVEFWRKKYPKFNEPKRTDLADLMLKHLGKPEPPPPLSMMVAPMVADGKALGFLRCRVAQEGPSYFSSDDLDLLQLVADYLSQALVAWRQEYRTSESRKREHLALKKFAQGSRAISKGTDEKDRIFLAAMDVVGRVLPEAVFNTIRIRRPNPDHLRYLGYMISPEYGISADGVLDRLVNLTLSLPGNSLAAKVVEKRQVKMFRGDQLTRHKSDAAEEAGEMIIAPIVVNGRVEGVLDLRTKHKEKFSPQARAVVDSISSLLALQMEKGRAEEEWLRSERQRLSAKSEAERERAENEKASRDAFEDVAHQIKSPLAEAARRVEQSLQRYQHGTISQDLTSIASLLRRAELSAKLVGLFANLAKGKQLTITGTSLTPVDLVKMAGQICENQRPRISPRRNIRIQFDADSFYRHAPSTLMADPELLLQSLNNLVDNAVKYSYPNTVIRVFGSLLRRGGFFIGVTNKGILIRPDEVNLVRQRNWRGETARASSGEGNGLGLWIVDHVMKAHGGELQILPTRPIDGITEVRLAFPLAK